MTQARAAKSPPRAPAAPAAKAPATGGRRIQIRKSGIHGKGVFALVPIPKGDMIIEYKGEVISWPEAMRRHPHDPENPNHTFYFELESGETIDGKYGGNAARWINHACKPNCEAEETDGKVYIKALRALKAGEELFFDYRLQIEGRQTKALKLAYECRCGAKTCRGTMLAPKG